MTTAGAASATVAFLDEKDGVNATDAHYAFTFTTKNPIPTNGFLEIAVPA